MRAAIFIVDELTIWALIGSAFRNPNTYYYKVVPMLRGMRGPLEWLVGRLERKRRIAHVRALSPDLPWVEGIPGRGWYNDIFASIEPQLHSHFGTDKTPPGRDPLAYLTRKVLNYYANRQIEILLLCEWIDANMQRTSWRLVGCHPNFELIYRWYFGRPVPFDWTPSRSPSLVLNVANFIIAAVYALIWFSLKARPWRIPHVSVRMIADGYPGYEHLTLAEVIDDPKDLIVFHRPDDVKSRASGRYACYRESGIGDGRLSLWVLPTYVAHVWRDLFVTVKAWRSEDPAFVEQLFVNIVKGGMYRAYFNRFRPRYFFSRDDYRTDHILRTRELRRVGATALGINHGLPRDTVFYAWREVDFDIYYAFGKHLYEKSYKEFWPAHMQVTPVGCYRIKRIHVNALRHKTSRDIAYFPMVTSAGEQILNEVFEIARQMPDRIVYIKPKPDRQESEIETFRAQLCNKPSNVVVREGDPYDVLLNVGYCLTPGSTLTVEALQYRCVSFVFDMEPEITQLYYRNFPALCVRSGAEVVARIRAIERGDERFSFEDYRELVKLDGELVYDVIRRDIGLQAKAA